MERVKAWLSRLGRKKPLTMESPALPVTEHAWGSGLRFARRGKLLQGPEAGIDNQVLRAYHSR